MYFCKYERYESRKIESVCTFLVTWEDSNTKSKKDLLTWFSGDSNNYIADKGHHKTLRSWRNKKPLFCVIDYF